jgi:ATP-dependent exoDNAse (exonuclease V) beta subunit
MTIMASKPAADHAERARALDPAASFIVQAPAGSGKTELLIQRYLGLLARVDQPEEIVAITFTNKAAAEMRGRILRAMAAARADPEPEADHARTTWRLARSVADHDGARGWRLELNPGRLRIQTVDSFCAVLTRQMPLLSRLGAQPEIVEDAAPLYREAAARMLAQLESGDHWSDAIAALLTHLDNDLPRVRDLIASMLQKRDQWLRHVARGVVRTELEAALERLVDASLAGLRRDFPAPDRAELIALADFAARNLEAAGRDSEIRACAGLTEWPEGRHGALGQWRGIVDLLLTKSGDWRRKVDVSAGFPAGKGRAAVMKERMSALLAGLADNDLLRRRLEEVRYLPPVRYDEREWQIAEALASLLVLAAAQLRVVFGERNQVDFTGIAMAANAALEEEGAPTDLALHLDHRIAHLLVDEFQDISINQYQLLERLTAGWQVGDGRTLFLVGDPMQSIYRFREAEVGKFLETWQRRRLGQVSIEPLRIRVNFRSRAGVVAWVNDVFQRVLPAHPDVARGAVNFAPAEPFHDADTGAAVIVHAQRGRDDEVEAQAVLDVLHGEWARDPAATVAILVRNRTHLHRIVPALQRAGIRFRAVDIEPLGERPAIQDLFALTRALQHLGDRIAWLAVLRAPWCGMTLTELAQLVEGNPVGTIWECLHDDARVASLHPAGRGRLQRLCDAFSKAHARAGRLPLHRQVEALWLDLGGPATLAAAADLANARVFFELLALHGDGGVMSGLAAFTEAVGRLHGAPDAEADGRLQIMTMHKAKGLEFDTVILPGLGRAGGRGEKELLIWDERAREHGGQDLLLAPIRAVGADMAPLYTCLEYFEQEREEYEEGRLLYVAATRAKWRLHLLGAAKERQDGELAIPHRRSPLRQLWPVIREAYESAPRAGGDRKANRAREFRGALRRLPEQFTVPAPPSPVSWTPRFAEAEAAGHPEFEWAGDTAMHIGTAYHRVIQQIAEEGVVEWNAARVANLAPAYRAMLRQLGVPGTELDDAAEEVRQALVNSIEDERGRWILSADHRDARNEFAVSGIYRGRPVNAIIDRTFVDADGVRWIIDYKTSRHEGGDVGAFLRRELERYAEPLSRYRALVSALHPEPVRTALYYPVLRGWVTA